MQVKFHASREGSSEDAENYLGNGYPEESIVGMIKNNIITVFKVTGRVNVMLLVVIFRPVNRNP